MNLLKTGARGPLVELLQTALLRAGCRPGKADGVFGACGARPQQTRTWFRAKSAS